MRIGPPCGSRRSLWHLLATPSRPGVPDPEVPPTAVDPRRPRCTERAYQMSPTERRQARQIGTYALGSLDARIAGSALGSTAGCRVVLCGSGASMATPERAFGAGA